MWMLLGQLAKTKQLVNEAGDDNITSIPPDDLTIPETKFSDEERALRAELEQRGILSPKGS